MSISVVAAPRSLSLAGRLGALLELTKPKIGVLVLLTVGVSAYLAGGATVAFATVLHAMLGVALVAGSSSAINQYLERRRDALMPRTADRPLPSGRLTEAEVAAFAGVTIVAGVAWLAWFVNTPTAVGGLVAWWLYGWVYTWLKSRTALNTAVGAVAGAMPVLLGWSAAGAPLDLRAAVLFTIVFLWQFPHFMAIAWLYRDQYRDAGLQMLTVVDPSGRRAGVQAVLGALALLPVSLLPGLLVGASGGYAAAAFCLGVGQLACAALFCRQLSDRSARRLLKASLIYLPALLATLVVVAAATTQ